MPPSPPGACIPISGAGIPRSSHWACSTARRGGPRSSCSVCSAANGPTAGSRTSSSIRRSLMRRIFPARHSGGPPAPRASAGRHLRDHPAAGARLAARAVMARPGRAGDGFRPRGSTPRWWRKTPISASGDAGRMGWPQSCTHGRPGWTIPRPGTRRCVRCRPIWSLFDILHAPRH